MNQAELIEEIRAVCVESATGNTKPSRLMERLFRLDEALGAFGPEAQNRGRELMSRSKCLEVLDVVVALDPARYALVCAQAIERDEGGFKKMIEDEAKGGTFRHPHYARWRRAMGEFWW